MGIFCGLINILIIPQGFINYLFGLVGFTAPDFTFGIGSLFGCNI